MYGELNGDGRQYRRFMSQTYTKEREKEKAGLYVSENIFQIVSYCVVEQLYRIYDGVEALSFRRFFYEVLHVC